MLDLAAGGKWFEFHEWKQAFAHWKEVDQTKFQFVMSKNEWTSGYWIEPINSKLGKQDVRYLNEEVPQLEQRIIDEHALAEKEQRGIRFTT